MTTKPLPYTPDYRAKHEYSCTVLDRMRESAKKLRIEDIDWAEAAGISLALLLGVFKCPASLTLGNAVALSDALGCQLTMFTSGVKYEVKG